MKDGMHLNCEPGESRRGIDRGATRAGTRLHVAGEAARQVTWLGSSTGGRSIVDTNDQLIDIIILSA